MNQLKKKITAYGFLLLVAMPLFFSVFYLIRQKAIQQEAAKNMETANLQTVTITSAELYWVKEGKEVLIDGKLFDVKYYSIAKGKIMLTGLFDGKEDKFVMQMTSMLQEKNGFDSPFDEAVVKFLFLPVFNESASFSIVNPWQIISLQFSDHFQMIAEVNPSLTTPPPKYI